MMPVVEQGEGEELGDQEVVAVDEVLAHIPPGVRQQLVLSALRLFSEFGFDRTKTRDISAGAKLSAGALYVYFVSKEEILFEISRAGHQAIDGLIERCCDATGTPSQRARGLFVEFVGWHARNAMISRVIYREWSVLIEEHRTEIRKLRRLTQSRISELIDAGVASGDFDVPDATIVTYAVTSLGIDVSRWFGAGRTFTSEELAEGYADLSMRMLGADLLGPSSKS